MRLTPHQTQAIITTFLEVFGKGEIRLFGSRVDDNRHGGDIDLYVNPDLRERLGEARIQFLARLKRRIGEQKIDLVIAASPPRPIDTIAQKNGVLLCQMHGSMPFPVEFDFNQGPGSVPIRATVT